MTRVESSHVWEVGYEDGTLHVHFWPSVAHPDGKLVKYLGVDPKTADAVLSASSIGVALHAMVRGKYEVDQ